MGKKNTILQSAKLMVSVREVFMNDEKDLEYSKSVYEKYVQNITEIEKGLINQEIMDAKEYLDAAASQRNEEVAVALIAE